MFNRGIPFWRPKGVRGTIVLSNLLTRAFNSGGTSYTTNSISPTAGAYVLMSVMTNRTGSGSVRPVVGITGAGITWTRLTGTDPLNTGMATEIGYSLWGGFSDGTAGAQSIDVGGLSENDCTLICSQATNVDTSTPVIQTTNVPSGSNVNTISATLGTAIENVNNVSFAACGWNSNLAETNISSTGSYDGITLITHLASAGGVAQAINHAYAVNTLTGGYTWSGTALRAGLCWVELKSAIV